MLWCVWGGGEGYVCVCVLLFLLVVVALWWCLFFMFSVVVVFCCFFEEEVVLSWVLFGVWGWLFYFSFECLLLFFLQGIVFYKG